MYISPPEPLLIAETTAHFGSLLCGLSRQWRVCSLICKSHRSAVAPENHSTPMARYSRNCPPGPVLIPRMSQFKPSSLLPNGRLVHVARDRTILAYNPDNPDNAKGVILGNLFSNLPAEHSMQSKLASYRRTIAWSTVMDDGRLLAACEVAQTVDDHGKTLFLICDPYSQPEKSEPPPQEESLYACRIV